MALTPNDALALVSLRDLPLASVILTTIFLVGSLVAVGFRSHVRYQDCTFGLDDAFILVGAVCAQFDEAWIIGKLIKNRYPTL